MKKLFMWIGVSLLIIICIPVIGFLMIQKNVTIVSVGMPIPEYNIEKPALLVIDIQEGTTGEVSTYDSYKNISDSLIQRINRIIEQSNENQILIIYIKNEITSLLINFIDNSMAKGSEGAQLDKRLMIVNENIIPKEAQDAFSNPELDNLLLENRVSHLYVVGLDAAGCINSTINAALNREYKISVIIEGIASETDSLKIKMLQEYKTKGVELLTMKEYFRQLEGTEKMEF